MVYHGRVKNGIIVLDGDNRLPEGAAVRVVILDNDESPTEPETPNDTIWDALKTVIGTGHDMPDDFASQHDHYLYGTPKR